MQPQKLCLKWNNHTANLLSVLGGFQQRDILVDVTISCEGQNIKAHKMVLSACSPYFQNIFLENPCQHPIVIINGFKYEDITAILNFMYKGEVNVSQDGLTSFLQAAEALKVKGLAEVCGEKRSTNSSSQDVQPNEQPTQNRPQRTDTPPRKRHRNRKRSLSDSNRSDDEGSSRKHREPSSPEVHELSGDESFTGDTNSNGPPFNSTPRVPQNVYSRSHQSSANITEDDDEFEVEPSKLLEQTLTTDNVSMNNSTVDNKLRIERIMGNAEMESSNMQEPESPPDVKPIIDYGDSSAGPSEGSMMLYNEQSQPGPSSLQDGSLLHDNAHAQGKKKALHNKFIKKVNSVKSKKEKLMIEGKALKYKCKNSRQASFFQCRLCDYRTSNASDITDHLHKHEVCSNNCVKHKAPFNCYHCSFKTDTEQDIASHLLSHAHNKQYGFKANKTLSSIQHPSEKNMNPTQKQTPVFFCDTCNEEFYDLHNLECHRKFSHRHELKVCKHCKKRFTNFDALKNHMKSHESDSDA